jgi:hypothetical protein
MTLKKYTPLFTAAVLALALVGAGCSTTSSHPQAVNQDRNFIGLVDIKPHSYASTSNSSIAVHTNELINKPDMTGDQVSLLWGMVNLEDY